MPRQRKSDDSDSKKASDSEANDGLDNTQPSDEETLGLLQPPKEQSKERSRRDIGSGTATSVLKHDKNEQDALLHDIVSEFDNGDDSLCSPVLPQLADIVNKRWSEKMTDKKLKEKLEKYGRPSNCEKLMVPKVNPEIWQQDLRLANVQNAVVKAGKVLTVGVEAMLEACK